MKPKLVHKSYDYSIESIKRSKCFTSSPFPFAFSRCGRGVEAAGQPTLQGATQGCHKHVESSVRPTLKQGQQLLGEFKCLEKKRL